MSCRSTFSLHLNNKYRTPGPKIALHKAMTDSFPSISDYVLKHFIIQHFVV
jgi:hypothetical protein